MVLGTFIVRCPACHLGIDASEQCHQCGRRFLPDAEGVYDLLPLDLAEITRNEDREWSENGPSGHALRERPWQIVISAGSASELRRFDQTIIDRFPTGRFLEIGGGPGLPAAMYKSLHPEAQVYATDVSIPALRAGRRLSGGVFPILPDVYAAINAEDLPFHDASFDAIFAMAMMHHLARPDQMLREIARVLKPGGVFIAVDHCVPSHFQWLFSRVAESRSKKLGIRERLLSFGDWRSIVQQAGLPLSVLVPVQDARFVPDPAFALLGRLVGFVPSSLAIRLLPVGMTVVYQRGI